MLSHDEPGIYQFGLHRQGYFRVKNCECHIISMSPCYLWLLRRFHQHDTFSRNSTFQECAHTRVSINCVPVDNGVSCGGNSKHQLPVCSKSDRECDRDVKMKEDNLFAGDFFFQSSDEVKYNWGITTVSAKRTKFCKTTCIAE